MWLSALRCRQRLCTDPSPSPHPPSPPIPSAVPVLALLTVVVVRDDQVAAEEAPRRAGVLALVGVLERLVVDRDGYL